MIFAYLVMCVPPDQIYADGISEKLKHVILMISSKWISFKYSPIFLWLWNFF